MKSRLFSLLLVVLLVSSAATPAAATSTTVATDGTCSKIDEFLFLFTQGFFLDNAMNADDCDPQRLNEQIMAVEEAEDNQTEVDIYSAASSHKASRHVTYTFFDNYANDTEANAWMKAETAVAQAFENGSSKSVAKVEAREAIKEYYSVKQRNLIEGWEVDHAAMRKLRARAQNESGVPDNMVHMYGYETSSGSVSGNMDIAGWSEKPITLINGTTLNVTATEHTFDGEYAYATPDDARVQLSGLQSGEGWVVEPPDEAYDELRVYDTTRYQTRWNKLEEMNLYVQEDVDVFVDAIWTDLDSGAINSSEVLSRPTLMYEYGTNGTQMYNVIGALAQSGFETPTLNGTGMMSVAYESGVYDGMLFARNVPGGEWNTSKTYNTTNFDGPVFLARTDGGMLELDGEFSISEMTNKEGNSIEKTSTTRYVYKTANTSELQASLEDLQRLTEEIEARQAKAGGGGSSDSGWSWDWLPDLNDPWLLAGAAGASLAVVAALGVVLKMSRPY